LTFIDMTRILLSTVVNLLEVAMSRLQLALNVSDLRAAIDFYSKLFDADPAKVRPGYANFAVAEPPLKLVLIEDVSARGGGVAGALNHLGVEVASPDEVVQATRRLSAEGLVTKLEEETTCCYAVQDKVWVSDPDGAPWEVYTVLADAPIESGVASDGGCCGSASPEGTAEEVVASSARCC
jgi:catechol 2,3-dioxygenase-like lactoylglutathione lyase family enzyme